MMNEIIENKATGFLAKIATGRKFWAFMYTCTSYTFVMISTAWILKDKIEKVAFSDVSFWMGLGYAAIAAVFFAANAVEHLAKAYAIRKQ